jgi:hypothetical protein
MYLVKIRSVIDKNQVAPFEFLKPTLKEVIVNKRKLELIRKFERKSPMMPLKTKSMRFINNKMALGICLSYAGCRCTRSNQR